MNESNFQHILRVLNTNLDGKVKVMFALTSIKGVGRRFSNVACKKAEVDLNKRCAACTHSPPTARTTHRVPPLLQMAVYHVGGARRCTSGGIWAHNVSSRVQGGRADR